MRDILPSLSAELRERNPSAVTTMRADIDRRSIVSILRELQEDNRSRDLPTELESDRELERTNTIVTLEIIRRFSAVLDALPTHFLSLSRDDRLAFVTAALKSVWPDNDGARKTTAFFLREINPLFGEANIRLGPHTKNAYYGTDVQGRPRVCAGVALLLDASTAQEIAEFKRLFPSTLVHEMEHLAIGGEGGSDASHGEDSEQRFDYLANLGEMRAYAKGCAYLYYQHFPNEPFSSEKMQTLSTTPKGAIAAYYRDMPKSANPTEIAVAKTMVTLTAWFVSHLNEIVPTAKFP